MARKEFTKKVRVAAFARSGGRCECCGVKLMAGNIEYDHIIPDGLTGEPTLDNCLVSCKNCHRAKTTKKDVPNIARAKRREAKHIGIKKERGRPIPGSKRSRWKRKLDGTVEER